MYTDITLINLPDSSLVIHAASLSPLKYNVGKAKPANLLQIATYFSKKIIKLGVFRPVLKVYNSIYCFAQPGQGIYKI